MFNTILVTDDGHGHWRDALRLARHLGSSGTSCALGSLTSPGEVAEAARREGADLIVVGSGRGAARLMHGAPAPVAVAPSGLAHGPDDRIRVVGVGFDGQPESRAALGMAEQIALEHDATMRVYAVVPPNPMTTSRIAPSPEEYRRLISESLDGQLRDEVSKLHSGVRAAASVIRGDPVETLAARTREGLDLLVLGSRGYGPLRRVLFGSVSRELIGKAECPVLVLPRQVSPESSPTVAPANIAAAK
jgi:nucleotide-binding universal stress UspA family protein